MPASPKIITKLQERRRIEADLRDMLDAPSDLDFRRQAQRIASLGSQVIPAIVGNLDEADTRLLTAMGVVATFLDHDEVTDALREAALQPGRTDQGRIGAMTILERFLGVSLDDELLESLSDPEGVAISSLEEVLAQVEQNPAISVEYVHGLDQQEPDVVLAVIGALKNLAGAEQVELLRMMAQDVRDEIAEAALAALADLRLLEAAAAIQTLVPIVHPELQPMAERSLRKLRFAGVHVRDLPDPDPNWRALVSPVDGQGQQSVWFIQDGRGAAQARFLNVLLSDRAGAVEAMGHSQISVRALPPRRLLGYVHDVPLPDEAGALLMVEATFDTGRRLVLEALAHNRETQIPVAGVLRLLSPWLWSVGGADFLTPLARPDLSEVEPSFLAEAGRLLAHPAFATWTAYGDQVHLAGTELGLHPGWEREIWVRRLASDLMDNSKVAEVFRRRLTAMSEWLLLAGEEEWARLALVSAQAMSGEHPEEHPFVRALVRRDLDLTLRSVQKPAGAQPGRK